MTATLLAGIVLLGLAAGILSGLIGIGGGILLVPALIYFLHYSQHQAQGTSLGVLSMPVVLLAFLKYYTDLKHTQTPIDWRVVLLLATGFVVGGYLGSSLSLKLDKETLRKMFAVVLFYTAVNMMKWDARLIAAIKKIF